MTKRDLIKLFLKWNPPADWTLRAVQYWNPRSKVPHSHWWCVAAEDAIATGCRKLNCDHPEWPCDRPSDEYPEIRVLVRFTTPEGGERHLRFWMPFTELLLREVTGFGLNAPNESARQFVLDEATQIVNQAKRSVSMPPIPIPPGQS